MVRELRLPVSMFLTDAWSPAGYGHFARLRAVGASVQNHTLDHPALRGLPYAGQRAEICGQQDKLRGASASGPALLRPAVRPATTAPPCAPPADCGVAGGAVARPRSPGSVRAGTGSGRATSSLGPLPRPEQLDGRT